MQLPDLINGAFEAGGSIFILNHCRVLYQDKLVRGVSLTSSVFFFSWGLWNIYYYDHLEQMFSWYAGIAVCMTNLLWIFMMIYYRRYEVRNHD